MHRFQLYSCQRARIRRRPMKWKREHAKRALSSPSPKTVGVVEDERRAAYPGRMFGYRDWARRAAYLASLLAKHALTRSVLEQYRPRNLWKVVAFLQYEEHDTDAKMCHKLLAQLRKFLQLRMKPMAPHPFDPVNVIRLEWTSRLLRYIPLRQILEDEQVASRARRVHRWSSLVARC